MEKPGKNGWMKRTEITPFYMLIKICSIKYKVALARTTVLEEHFPRTTKPLLHLKASILETNVPLSFVPCGYVTVYGCCLISFSCSLVWGEGGARGPSSEGTVWSPPPGYTAHVGQKWICTTFRRLLLLFSLRQEDEGPSDAACQVWGLLQSALKVKEEPLYARKWPRT